MREWPDSEQEQAEEADEWKLKAEAFALGALLLLGFFSAFI